MAGVRMELDGLLEAEFRKRSNRFVGEILISGSVNRVHIADPGRMKELLFPSASVLVQEAPEGSNRKTGYSLVAARGSSGWVLVNTSLHRRLATALLEDPVISPFGPISSLRAEVRSPLGGSRFDFLLETEDGDLWLEVKGCTLERDGLALFPDAPTVRGTKHLRELTEMSQRLGMRTAVLFLIFVPEVRCLVPNTETDPGFADAFENALAAGVDIRGAGFALENGCLAYTGPVPCGIRDSKGC